MFTTRIRNLVDLLRYRAKEPSRAPAYTFLNSSLEVCDEVAYAELHRRAMWIAGALQRSGSAGERALLLYPPGISFIEAFFGSLYAGWIAVPAYLPTGSHHSSRIESIVRDAKPKMVLTSSAMLPQVELWLRGFSRIHVLATDPCRSDADAAWRPPRLSGDEIALLQYTSGSISAPKGVMVSHKNLLHNERTIQTAFEQSANSVTVSWLPAHHDMGLIGGVLQPAYTGSRCILLAPVSFLQSPRCWLETISRYKATTSGGPNFAYDLCSRRIAASDCAGIDLSTWTVAFNGSEPVHSRTLRAFAEKFGPYGFQRKAFYPCYGLAEATLFVSGASVAEDPVISKVSSAALQEHRVSAPSENDGVDLVGCGYPRNDKVIIVNPRTRRRCVPDEIGEIWVAGETVARGYWKKQGITGQIFKARLANEAGHYLRTGDLGFFKDDELFITGRLKDIVIIRGRNYYPQDLELTAEASHPWIRAHRSAAFAVSRDNSEALVIVSEVSRTRKEKLAEAAAAIRRSIAQTYEINVADVVLVRPGGVPTTSSGKIQRLACRARYLRGDLPVLAQGSLLEGPSELPLHTSLAGLSRKALMEQAPEQRVPALITALCQELARSLNTIPERLDCALSMAALGVDSLAAVQLSHTLEKSLQISISLSELVQGPSIERLALRIVRAVEDQDSVSASQQQEESYAAEDLPLSYGQRALWFLNKLSPESSAYNIACGVKCHSEVDLPALHRTLTLLAKRHAALRTGFSDVGGEPVQQIHEEPEFEFQELDASSWDEAELISELEKAAARPFTFEEKSLLRVNVYRWRKQSVLLLVVHHIVSDFWSMAVLGRELGELYRQETGAGAANLEPIATECWQYARKMRARINGAEGGRLESYWAAKLRDLPPYIDLPLDKTRPRVQTFRGGCVLLELEAELMERVHELAKSGNTSLFVSLLAAFYTLLHRYTGQPDLAVGVPVAARPSAELAHTVGYFANPIVLRSDITSTPTFTELLQQVKNNVSEALEHQDFPFPLLVERMNAGQDVSRSPLFQTAFVFQKAVRREEEAFAGLALGIPGLRFQLGGLSFESAGIQEKGSQFDLTLRAAEIGGRLFCSLLYNPDLFDRETVSRLARHYRNVLEEATARPGQSVSQISILSAEERAQVVQSWPKAEETGSPRMGVHALVEAKASQIPDAVAVICGVQHLTYGELNRQADCVARLLQREDIRRESRVAICLGRRAEMPVAMLGALKAGAAYVPIDPGYPRERQQFMLKDSSAHLLITEKGKEDLAPGGMPVLTMEGAVATESEFMRRQDQASERNLAWIIYTSGSTGKPKGVGIEHRGALALLNWAEGIFTAEEMHGVLASTSWCFDLSAFEIWAPLARGGMVILAENALELPVISARERVQLVNTVPSAAQELARQNAFPVSVKTINLAGEALGRKLANKLLDLGHVKRVLNLYGPTEDTTYSTWAEIGRGESTPAIGKAIPGSRAYVLDDNLEPLPPGIVGELYLGGFGLARGYVGRPDLTAERFLPDPFNPQPGERIYRTGDRVRCRRDGELEYHGRADHQVKLRGFRIELGEIEASLEKVAGVRECVVEVRQSSADNPQLAAYVVLEESAPGITEVRQSLQQRLPAHMIPAAFVNLAALPRTANGKVDRRALPQPKWAVPEQDFVPPHSPSEKAVALIWQKILGKDAVSITANFFELGGHSLLATRVVSELHESLNVQITLREFFENSTVALLAKLVDAGSGQTRAQVLPDFALMQRPSQLPLSFAQERIWFLEQLEPESLAYNVAVSLRIEGLFSAATARESLAWIVQRHESLRTVFPMSGNVPIQKILPEQQISLPVSDISSLNPGQQEEEIRRIARHAALQPFDLNNGPLMRLELLRLGPELHVLLLNLHHIICDGWSFGILAREFRHAYQAISGGRRAGLPVLSFQYADYAIWQRRLWQEGVLADDLRYWKEKLAGLSRLDVPLDRVRSSAASSHGESCQLVLDPALMMKVRQRCRQSDATLFMVVLAAWQTVLSRYCRQSDVAVGSPVAGRARRRNEELVGCLVNTLVLRADFSGNPTIEELLRQVREVALEAYAHQELPFDKLVEELQPERTIGRTPLFDVSLTLQNAPLVLSGDGFKLTQVGVEFDRVKFDLSLTLTESEEALQGELSWRADLFDRVTIHQMGTAFRTILEQMAENSSERVAELALLSSQEYKQLVHQGNQPYQEYFEDVTIPDLFEKQAARTPDAVALAAEGSVLTYRELNERANQVAHAVSKLGVRSENLVGIFLERSEKMVVALLAVLKAGAAYLPLDTTYPPERVQYMLRDAEASLLLSEQPLLEKLGDIGGMNVLCLDRGLDEATAAQTENPSRKLQPGNLAYVIYTSGSTGKPKGAAVTHANVQRLLAATDSWFHFSDSDSWTLFHSYAFDFSVWEIWGALLYGGRLVVVPYWVSRSPEEFWELLAREKVTVLNQTPSAFRQLVEADARKEEKLPFLRLIIFGGEGLDVRKLQPWWDRYGDNMPELVNMYGITETTVHVTYKPLKQAEIEARSPASPIGVPIPDLRVYVVEPSGKLAPIGVYGEIYVGGAGVTRGYLKRPELTAEKFVPDPFSGREGARLYRSGDLARRCRNGELEYLGRIDQQIKVRGFRIELGEIEALLSAHPAVKQAVVIARQEKEDTRLLGYLVLNRPGESRTVAELHNYLRRKLPEYMVPALMDLEKLPLTTNGKLDHKALPIPEIQDAAGYVAPRTPSEEMVGAVWSEVLGHKRISVDANFFELGGHSLLATRVTSRLRELFHIELPLRDFFEKPTVALLAYEIEKRREIKTGAPASPPLTVQARTAEVPLSFAQERIWVLEQMEPGTSANNIPIALSFKGGLSMAALEQAIAVIALRHDSLRTVFVEVEGQQVQKILPWQPLHLNLVDLGALSEEHAQRAREDLMLKESERVFDLERGPLFRSTLLRCGDDDHLLLLTMHHIISDGWSLGVFSRELTTLYQDFVGGRPGSLPRLAIQYADYCCWQRKWIKGSVREEHLRYWRERLGELPPVLELPTDHPRPDVRTTRGASHGFVFPQELVHGVQELSIRSGCTRFMVLFSGYLALLYRYSGQTDLCVGTFIANRNRAETENLIGFFVNNLALRVDVRDRPTFHQLLDKVRQTTLDAYAHQDLPFEAVLEDLRLARSKKHSPLFQTMFVLQNTPAAEFRARGVQVNVVPVENTRSNFDITLWVEEREGLRASLQYNRDLFEAITIERMSDHLRRLLDSAICDWDRNISELPLLSLGERSEILAAPGFVTQLFDPDAVVHRIFEKQAARCPKATAILCREDQLTYEELNERANRVAHRLIRLGAAPEHLIALLAERSPEAMIGVLGILKAGCGYVPLDPRTPVERMHYMLQDSGSLVLLAQRKFLHLAPAGLRVVALDDAEELAKCPVNNPVVPVSGGNAAYLIYTSGSTGLPKSVLIEHHSLTNHTLAAIANYRMSAQDRVLQFASLSFDASAEEIYPCLLSGATLVLRSDEMLASPKAFFKACEEFGVTVLDLPTAYWHALAAALETDVPALPSCLRLTILGGERALPQRAFPWVRAGAPEARLVNTYGPTEATIVATHCDITHLLKGTTPTELPIGRPIANVRTYVLDENLELVPLGVSGQLHIGGAGLARHYLRRPELTAEKFIPDPFADSPGQILYQTGDYVRQLRNGLLEFVGRKDRQIKIRGNRIELSEIETRLAQYPGLQEAAVVAHEDSRGEQYLAAYVVSGAEPPPDAADLRTFLKNKLPEYMIPSVLVTMERMPLTSAGKLDIARLPVPLNSRPELAREFVPPDTPTEDILAGIWSEVLHVPRVSMTDGFFDLGGYSLLATQVIARIREVFSVELPLNALFETSTLRELASQIAEASRITTPRIQPISRDEELPLSFAQERIWFLTQLDPSISSYHVPRATRAIGHLNGEALQQSYSALVRRHEILRTTFPQVEGKPIQQIHKPFPVPLPVVDLSSLNEGRKEALLSQLIVEAGQQLFDIQQGPLIRARLVRLSAQEAVIVQTEHHLVHDGWAEGVLTRDILAFYSAFTGGRPAELAPLPIQFADFAAWQKNWMKGEVLESQLSFWKDALAGAPPLLNLPTDHARPALQSFKGGEEELRLPLPVTESLRELSRREGATLFMTAYAAFVALLHRYSGQDDLVLGTVVANRSHQQTEGLLGMILNTLPMRTNLGGDPTFRELLARVRQGCLKAYANQDVPFEKLVDVLKPERNLSYAPIFQVMFAFHDAPRPNLELPGLSLQSIDAHNRSSKFDMLVISSASAEGLTSLFEYSTDLFEASTIRRFVRQYAQLLHSLPECMEKRLSALEYLPPDELRQVLYGFNDTAGHYAAPHCLHQLFEEQAQRTPDATALATSTTQLTYAGLNQAANRLAYRLRRLKLECEQRVAIYSNRSAEMVIGILAVLKAGGAYVPIDPAYPPERQMFILKDSGARFVLMQQSLAGRLPKADVVPVFLDSSPSSAEPCENPEPTSRENSVAYLIYTSGSTGIPKGVAIEHRSALTLARWARNIFQPAEFSGMLASTSLCFDLSIFELFVPLSYGGTVLLVENILALPERWLEGRVTLVNTVPSGISEVIAANGLPSSARTIGLAGEPLRRELVRKIYAHSHVQRVFNLYGPSEATTYSTFAEVCKDNKDEPAIGCPIADTRTYVLDQHLRPMPIGVPGELFIGGAGVARGYLGRAELTAEKFVPDPWGEQGGRLYRTGDLVKWNVQGALEFLGRMDHQVKIRGYRIEPGEVETALRAHAAVHECAVIAHRAGPDELRLVAYIVTAGDKKASERELREYLRVRIPEYMVPFSFMFLQALPLTPNGKLDRNKLPAPGSGMAGIAPPVPTVHSEIEGAIASIWKEALGREDIDVRSNFFDLGGHSLLLIRIHHRIRRDLGFSHLELIDLFKHPTVESLARYLTGASQPVRRQVGLAQPLQRFAEERAVAIVGMAGRFPGAANINEFWSNLCAGVDSISHFTEEELEAAGVDRELLKDPHYVRAKGLIEDIEKFDARFFGYSPREAEIMDPQHRLFLECAWEALEDAGYDPFQYEGAVGVYAGCGMSSYWQNLYSNPELIRVITPYQAKLGNDKDYLPTRVAYKLNLRGPAVSVQTACSTSLVAIHLACRSLIYRECDMALAGGASIVAQQKSGYLFQEGGIHSPDGVCRAFDGGAAGTVGGNGLGVVLLKRLSDARAAGDHIYAVIKGTALGNDGANKIGYTAPSVDGQARVIRETLAYAGVEPASIGYIETHGTGTVLGDPIEVAALKEAFAAQSVPANSCPIGSLKTNIGHLDAAAGVAGLIKTALALKHGKIPPSLHYIQANPKIDFAQGPFFVNTRLSPWNMSSGPRRAGVSSFGIGGTNAHAVLEEAPPAEIGKDSRPWQLLLLSAATASALETLTVKLNAFLQQNPNVSLPDVAYTLQVGRRGFAQRRMLVCRDREEAVSILNGNNPELLITGSVEGDSKPVMFMFPGFGAQRVNMAQELYRNEKTFRAVMDECAGLFKTHLGVDLRDALYPNPEAAEAAESELQEVTLSMASTFALECALAAQWMEWGITPEAMIGHSLGEYAAAYIAGVFSLADAVHLVAARSSLMQQTPPGAMITVALSERELAVVLPNDLSIAAVNAENQCVAAGTAHAIDELERQLADQGISTNRLHVRRASHSALVDPVLEQFEEIARSIQYRPPRIPFISCVTGTWITSGEATDPGYWVRHLRQTVRFDAGLTETFRSGSKVLLELGPGRTLTSLALRHPGRKPDVAVLSSLRSGTTQLEAAATLQGLGRAWLAGLRPNWTAFYDNERRSRVPLPTYPFEREYYWIQPGELQAAPSSRKPLIKKKDVSEWFYVRSWKRTALVAKPSLPPRQRWLVFAGQEGLTRRLTESLASRGQEVVIVEASDHFECLHPDSYRVRPHVAEDYGLLVKELIATGRRPQRILYAWTLTPAAEKETQGEGFEALQSFLWTAQSASTMQDAASLRIDVLSTGVQAVSAKDRVIPERAAILGICKVIPQEFPHIACRVIDLDPSSCYGQGPRAERLAEYLLRELLSDEENYVAYREHARWMEDFASLPLNDAELGRSQLRDGGTYVIFGGMGQIGMTLAAYLAREFHCKLVLTQRSPVPDPQQWPRESASNEWRDKLEQIRKIEEAGSQVLVFSADLANEEQVRLVVEQTILKFGAIHGVIHCAGLVGENAHRALEETGADELQAHLAAKAHGLQVLSRTLRGIDLDFCLLSSSLSSVLGGLGYYAYAAANNFMDAFVQQNPQRSGFRWMALNWDAWARERNTPDAHGLGGSMAQLTILPEEGIQVFERALGALDVPQVLVSTGDLTQRHQAWVTSKPATSLRQTEVHASHARPVLRNAYAEPSTAQERSIAEVLQELLGMQQIGIHDNFFELGGDSLLATQAVARLRRKLEINFSMRSFFENPTIAAFCKVLEESSLASEPALNVRADALHASRTIDKELEDLSNLSEDEVQKLIQVEAAS